MQSVIYTILMVYAHREDHILFGWPILQYPIRYKPCVIRCTGDYEDVVLQSNSKIKSIIGYEAVGLSNSFTRDIEYLNIHRSLIIDRIKSFILRYHPHFIVTHNPWGEYGHPDHCFLFNLIYSEIKNIPILVSDIQATSSYFPFNYVQSKKLKRSLGKKFLTAKPNMMFFNRHSKIFMSKNAWTRNKYLNPPLYPQPATLYEVPQ